ncbi:MAG: SGNH/GDSL hydrolase family protein, partial [Armatimonadetes bacterium]|nr:SGNH/GDSL hydrolase family protein [Candidatus Hippobium faecium]
KILFQGDSITDNLRADCTEFIGIGYTRFVTAVLRGKFPQLELEFVNRAISGNRTWDLVERWDWDTIHVKPDVCSIMIGVNDCWRRYDQNDPTSAEDYEKNYREMLTKCRDNGIKCILIEPYLTFTQECQHKWFEEDLIYKQDVVKKLAEEFDCEYIPMHDIFQEACKDTAPSYWSGDGVHPYIPGCYLIGKEILKVFGVEI